MGRYCLLSYYRIIVEDGGSSCYRTVDYLLRRSSLIPIAIIKVGYGLHRQARVYYAGAEV